MLPPLFRIDHVLEACQKQQLILTPNQRLRAKILQAYGHYQVQQGKQVWAPPRVYALTQWLEQQWQQLLSTAAPEATYPIASADKERILWQQITANSGLLHTDNLASQAQSAYNTLGLWNLSLDALNQYETLSANSTQSFRQWAKAFEDLLKRYRLISRNKAYRHIGTAFERGHLQREPAIALFGFDDVPPLIEQQLNQASPQVYTIAPEQSEPVKLQRLSVATPNAEMLAAAKWAKACLEQNSELRIGIIVPNLGQSRDQVERAFIEVFEPQLLDNNTDRYTLPFNFSAGIPLGTTPLIVDTLALLQLSRPHYPLEQITRILTSPFWGVDPLVQIQLSDKLQRLGKHTVSGTDLRYWAQQCQPENGQDNLFSMLEHNARESRRQPKRQVPSDWVKGFLEQLEQLRWPGERRPDSQEYQQTQLWYQVLEQFAALDDLLGEISFEQAFEQVQHMANHTPFQAQVPDSPIQILGILEGAGLEFSHCWIMGLHQQAWPPAPAPNPLLPISLQRQYGMPHADHLRELHFAQSLTRHYRYCAKHIIISAPQTDDSQETLHQPSQLITDIPLSADVPNAPSSQADLESYYQALAKEHKLEAVDCSRGPSLSQQTPLKGGSAVLKDQAGNPFDGFAIHRLGAKNAAPLTLGFSPIEQGNSLHNGLARLWAQLKDQATLLTMNDAELRQQVRECVSDSIAELKRQKPEQLGAALCELEIERQCRLIEDWLEVEKQRPPFSVVAIEEKRQVQLSQHRFELRIDRIDQLADGRFLIIDYKTGETSLNAWKGDRLKEPQLPLYALSFDQSLAGISFAQINIKAQTFKGLSEGDFGITGINDIQTNKQALPSSWEDAISHWQQTLVQLLQEYEHGVCDIQFRDSQTRDFSEDLLPLNRFNEADDIRQWLNAQTDADVDKPQ